MTALPMVGRGEEIATAVGAWERVVSGPGGSQIVVLTGEAGIGKSRLVAEVLGALQPCPASVLAGHARTHAPAPYDWLASALSGRPLPDLPVPDDALAWLTQRPDAPPRRFAPGALLRVAADTVRAVVGSGPAVVVVEDLHDLDPASLDLIGDVAVTADLPVLLVVTSRAPNEAAFPTIAGRVLDRLCGTPRTVRRHLAPLSAAEVAAVVEAGFGTAPSPEAVRAAHRRTGGNPYWLTELVAAYRAAGPGALAEAPVPDHLSAPIVERLAGEDPGTVRLAEVAALLGDRVRADDLVDACGGGIGPAVRRLVALGLLVPAPDGHLRFRYPLLREAIAARALPAARAAGHARRPAAVDDDMAGRDATPRAARLTAREREVLGCLSAGMTNQQVARSLGISVRTVTVHVSNLLRKTGSASRTEAALWAVRHGLAGRLAG